MRTVYLSDIDVTNLKFLKLIGINQVPSTDQYNAALRSFSGFKSLLGRQISGQSTEFSPRIPSFSFLFEVFHVPFLNDLVREEALAAFAAQLTSLLRLPFRSRSHFRTDTLLIRSFLPRRQRAASLRSQRISSNIIEYLFNIK